VDTRFAQSLAREALDRTGASAFRLLPVGTDGFVTRVEMVDGAERSLDVQYFIFRSDHTGMVMADALLRAADRGVRVRILLDDGETSVGDENIQLLDAHPNVEVRVFNPFAYRGHNKLLRSVEFLINSDRLDYRMHNKLLVADNAVALIGGRNVADEYFQIDPRRQFADDDMFSSGPVVQELSNKFDEYWNSDLAIPVGGLGGGKPSVAQLAAYREVLQDARDQLLPDGKNYGAQIRSGQPLANMLSGHLPVTWAHWKVVCDSPDKKKVEQGWRLGHLMERPVADAASAVQSELLMVTPYLIPGDEGMRLIDGLRARDVTVRLLTNSLETSTVTAAQAGYMHYRVPLVDGGVDLFEIRAQLGDSRGSGQTEDISKYGNYSLHGKMFVFDRKKVFIGSMNFDERSMHLNTEIGLIIDSDALAQQVATRFEAMAAPENAYHVELVGHDPRRLSWHTVDNGQHAHLEIEPARNPLQRLQVDVLTLLPLDKEL
jgi:putative cardiolipin synthase